MRERIPRGGEGRLSAAIERLRVFVTRDLWSIEIAGLPTFRALAVRVSRVLYVALRGFFDHRALFSASALTYITVLSLVPMLAFAFSVAKGLGAYEQLVHGTIEPFLDETFGQLQTAPAGAEGNAAVAAEAGAYQLRHALDEVLRFVQETDVGSLGFLGLVILVYAVIKLLGSVERAFNEIWGVRRSRTFVRKVADYLSMVVIVPLFLVIAAGLNAATQTEALLQTFGSRLNIDEIGLRLSSLAAIWIGFALLYVFMPNTRTRLSSAIIGGLVGGSLWYVAQIAHVRFQVGVANYNAIYSGFAAFPIFLLWIYVSWVTVLFGAEFASAHQNLKSYRQSALARQFDHGFKEVLALRAVVRIAAAFEQGREPYRLDDLAEELGIPERVLVEVVDKLDRHRVLAFRDDDPLGELLPARDLDRITIKLVLDALKGTTGPVTVPASVSADRRIDELLAEYERSAESSAANRTMRAIAADFVEEERRRALGRGARARDDVPG